MYANFSREPLVAQKFLPQVTRGDKRIILVDGDPVGAINRVPISGEIRSNMHVGGTATKIGLTERISRFATLLDPLLKKRDRFLWALMLLANISTEINVTSPTGLHELERFDGINAASIIWNAIDEKLKA